MNSLRFAISLGVAHSALFLSSCSSVMQPAQPDSRTGLIAEASKEASVLVDQPLDLANRKEFVFIPDDFDFAVTQTQKIGFFRKVYDQDSFDRMIIGKGLAARVPSTTSLVGWHQAYKAIGPYLVIRFIVRWDLQKKEFLKLQVLDPDSADIVFEAEVPFGSRWTDSGDRNTFYPLFNELIKWLKKNDRISNQSPEPTS